MSVSKAAELKAMKTQVAKLLAEADELTTKATELTMKASDMRAEAKKLQAKIDNAGQKEIVVSEHAMLRFLERAMGVDLDELSRRVLDDDTRALIDELGDGKYPIDEGLRAIVRNRVVVSVV